MAQVEPVWLLIMQLKVEERKRKKMMKIAVMLMKGSNQS
jgi:hypothetical protein